MRNTPHKKNIKALAKEKKYWKAELMLLHDEFHQKYLDECRPAEEIQAGNTGASRQRLRTQIRRCSK